MAKKAAKKAKRPAPSIQKDLGQEILQSSKTAKADPKHFAAAARYTREALKTAKFRRNPRFPDRPGFEPFYFRKVGDTLTGVLGKCDGMLGYQSFYPIVLDDGTVVHVPGNRRLVQCFKKAKCWFQRIKITYKDKLFKHSGHYEKIYSVESAPLDSEKERS